MTFKIFSKEDIKLLNRATKYANHYKIKMIILLFCIFAEIGLNLIQPVIWAKLISCFFAKDYNAVVTQIFYQVIVAISQTALGIIQSYLSSYLNESIVFDVKKDMYSIILNLPVKAFDEMRVGEFLSRLHRDSSAVSNIITKQFLNSIVDILKIIVLGILIFRISIPLALIILLLFPISSIVFIMFGRKLKKETAIASKFWDKHYSQIQESLFCIKEIKSLGIKDITLNSFLSLCKKIKAKSVELQTINTISQALNQLVNLLSNITTLGVGAYLIFKNILSIEQFMVFNSYSMQFRISLNNVTKLNSNVQESLVSLGRVFGLMDNLAYSKENFGASEISKVNGQITFEDVSFSYASGRPVLNLVSFKIPRNKVVSIVGKSGSGKTTIFNLLEKFYLPTEGKIKIDTFDLNEFTEKSLRSNVSIVRQDPVLFNMSIKQNLLLANPSATEQQIYTACKKAYIHDYIMSLPDKYESIVGEISSNFSGGQKQRIAICIFRRIRTAIPDLSGQ